jgi:hypothetical protein
VAADLSKALSTYGAKGKLHFTGTNVSAGELCLAYRKAFTIFTLHSFHLSLLKCISFEFDLDNLSIDV